MKKAGIIILLLVAVSSAVYFTGSSVTKNKPHNWQSRVMPGKLSAAHTPLSSNCASCHTPVKGVDDTKCISCHAMNKDLIQRQPTAFHAIVANCASCHIEHQGFEANLRVMDHEALVNIGSAVVEHGKNVSKIPTKKKLPADHPNVSPLVATLNCATCHSTKDTHKGLMGPDCASCHSATEWSIPEFQHPSVLSIDCSQCHQAPPSHYMMHFDMVSKKVAKQESVVVSQCYTCHQTTSWNDIKRVGYYKHH